MKKKELISELNKKYSVDENILMKHISVKTKLVDMVPYYSLQGRDRDKNIPAGARFLHIPMALE